MTCQVADKREQRSGQSGCAGSYSGEVAIQVLCVRKELGEADDHVVGRRGQVAGRKSQVAVANKSHSGRLKLLLLSSLDAVVSVVMSGEKEGRKEEETAATWRMR